MYNRNTLIRNVICVAVSVILLGWLVYMIHSANKKNSMQSEAIEAAKTEAYPYEKELRQLEAELEDMQEGIAYASDRAEIMVGFIPTSPDDLSYIKKQSQEYGFLPVIVLDCTLEKEVRESIIERMDKTWELMLYASKFSEEENKSVKSVLDYIKDNNHEHTGVFFLRNDYRTTENVQLLKDDGFIGYTVYNTDSPKAGQYDDGTVYFDYSYISSTSTSVGNRLASFYENKTSIIVVIDVASINDDKLDDEYITALFEALEKYADYDDCSFATVEDVVEELSNVNSIESDNAEELEADTSDIQKRIDELENIIFDIYKNIEY